MDPSWINLGAEGTSSLLACYHSLLRVVGLPVEAITGSPALPAPYNLFMTRQWLLLVRRSKEDFEDTSINALGFAGFLVVTETMQLAILKGTGSHDRAPARGVTSEVVIA